MFHRSFELSTEKWGSIEKRDSIADQQVPQSFNELYKLKQAETHSACLLQKERRETAMDEAYVEGHQEVCALADAHLGMNAETQPNISNLDGGLNTVEDH